MEKAEVKERTREAYDKVGADYDNWYWSKGAQKLRQRLTERVLELVRAQTKGRSKILEVCCGTGHLVNELSKVGKYTGLDFAPSMVAHCKKTYPKKKFVLGDAEDLPFKKNSFDVAICFWSFHHIVYPEQALDEMRRVLKPGGLIVIATFKNVSLNFIARAADASSNKYWGYTTKRHSKKDMQKLMKRFKKVEVEIFPKGISFLNLMGIRFLIASGRK